VGGADGRVRLRPAAARAFGGSSFPAAGPI